MGKGDLFNGERGAYLVKEGAYLVGGGEGLFGGERKANLMGAGGLFGG